VLTNILLGITGLFISGLLVKSQKKSSLKNICVLCLSILLTWGILLLLYKLKQFDDQVIIGILIGESITGFFYFIKRRIPKEFVVFALPFFLSLTVGAYMVLVKLQDFKTTFGILLAIWIISYVVFINRNDPGTKPIAKSVMNCCNDE